ncbi:MAG: choice-of-anchor B family protein [Planctomycetota bacterium]
MMHDSGFACLRHYRSGARPAAPLRLAVGLAICFAGVGSALSHPEAEGLIGAGNAGSAARFGFVESSGMVQLSHLSLEELDTQFGSFSANDCWGYTTPGGREIAMIGLRNATAFVDITEPYTPALIGLFESPSSLWRDIKVLDDHAYAVSEGGGYIQVFDMSQADEGVIADLGSPIIGGGERTHNIAIDETSGFLHRCGADGSLHVYSVGARGLAGSPTQPAEVADIFAGFYVHDAQIVTYTEGPYAGRQIGFLSSVRDVRIWDLTDKQNPFEISTVRSDRPGYIHQGWLDDERRYFYMNDERDRGPTKMHIFNVEDLENPSYVKVWQNGVSSVPHNLYVRGDRLFAANYTTGLRVFDISDRENPAEVAWLDTFPSQDGGRFDGAWSNFPFFPSGTIIVSDINSGLFVARLEEESIVLAPSELPGDMWQPAGGELLRFDITSRATDAAAGSAELVIRTAGGSETRIPGTIDGPSVEFTSPEIPCLADIEWWVEITATDGGVFGFPAPFGVDPVRSLVASEGMVAFADDAESDPGWEVGGDAFDGGWERGVPVNAGRGDPEADADGSGRAWLTSNSSSNGGNSDVDGGSVTLTSPSFSPLRDGALSFRYWLGDTDFSPFGEGDGLSVQVDAVRGFGWETVRTYTEPTGQWVQDRLMPGVDLPFGGSFRVRFVATDDFEENVVEAGVDDVRFVELTCEPCPNPADANGDGAITPADFTAWIDAINDGSPACDQNGDGLCTAQDFTSFILNFNRGCP